MEILTLALVAALIGVGSWAFWQRNRLAKTVSLLRAREAQAEKLCRQLEQTEQQNRALIQERNKLDALVFKLREDLAQQDSHLEDVQGTQQQWREELEALRQQIAVSAREAVQSKALFSTLANIAYDLVFVLDEELTIIAYNKSAELLFGAKNPIGERLSDIINAPELDDIVLRALREEEGMEEQFSFDGHYYRVRTRLMRYDAEHAFIGVALQDITQLVRLNRARRDMVANISHELRTPIANIRLIIESLFHEQDRPKRKASIASLRDIARETDSLLWLVQELLDLSMIESGQAIMKLVPVPLHEIVEESVARLEDQLAVKDLTVVRHIPQRINVLCDRDQTRRVFTNLIKNAIRYSPPHDAITISATVSGDEVTISVFDNGPGVPDDQRERIFERFYQVDTSRSGSEGTGLGLAICRHIVEAHGGRIWAEGNSQGGGGRFLFTLLNADGEYTPAPPMDRGQHDADLRILPGAVPDIADMPGEADLSWGDEGR